jgi:hypothetical protein
MGLKTPVLLIIFNRPDTTQQVFDAIRLAEPRQLFVAADGPREGKNGEAEKCRRARGIVKQLDWDCEVKTLFQEKNLGCGLGPATAINWFFENVEEGIILEDDCLPHPDFFRFCEELLAHHRHNERIMEISGDNFQDGHKRGNASYYFSAYPHNWGWATWGRAWKHYNYGLIPADEAKHVWDRQWLISVARNNGLAIVPNVNLVSNIGSGLDATHTTGVSKYANLPTESLAFPLVHPKINAPNRAADSYDSHIRGEPTTIGIIRRRIMGILPNKARRAIGHVLLRGRKG